MTLKIYQSKAAFGTEWLPQAASSCHRNKRQQPWQVDFLTAFYINKGVIHLHQTTPFISIICSEFDFLVSRI